ncbi:hypothetical protein D5R81_00865 [Parashewanella spongiae]|uniref:Uncharacterized protein n=1 Tax=Parashewanella spongiae TaxID=342950 RepID=A0A3A6UNL0_9GAMM|nr:hypothetical protein [Parashewanella spongiae]MCL1078688.1 hypothetical protein [Parashewanella spongiae]RJY19403.1 hypothetical protein D5R81_00865 [Parashewanella spongiae]
MSTGELSLNYNSKLSSLTYSGEVFKFNNDTTNTNVVKNDDNTFSFLHNGITFTVNAERGQVTLRGPRERLEQFHTKGTYKEAYLADVDDNGDVVGHQPLKSNSRYSAKNMTGNANKNHKIFKPLDDWLAKDPDTIHALTHLTAKHKQITHHDPSTLEQDLKAGVKLSAIMSNVKNYQALDHLAYLRKDDDFKPEDYEFVFKDITAARLASYKEHARRILKKIDQLQAINHAKDTARLWKIAEASIPVEVDEGELSPISSTDSDNIDDSFIITPTTQQVQNEMDSNTQLSDEHTGYTSFPEGDFHRTTGQSDRMTAARRYTRICDPSDLEDSSSQFEELDSSTEEPNTIKVEVHSN